MRFHSLASYKHTQNPLRGATAGFSMIELLVSISIIVLVLTITLTRQSAFNSAVLLRSEAFDIALAIREVQLSAVSAAGDGSGGYRSTMGVHLAENSNEYVLFRDGDSNNKYDAGEEFGGQGNIDPRFEIGSIDVGGSEVAIIFRRPNFDALFYDAAGTTLDAAAVQIELRLRDTTEGSCGDQWRIIEITSAGQIAVQNCP
jgi:prepilin-type N-terminal cleavage/methylation domain-containing protein